MRLWLATMPATIATMTPVTPDPGCRGHFFTLGTLMLYFAKAKPGFFYNASECPRTGENIAMVNILEKHKKPA